MEVEIMSPKKFDKKNSEYYFLTATSRNLSKLTAHLP